MITIFIVFPALLNYIIQMFLFSTLRETLLLRSSFARAYHQGSFAADIDNELMVFYRSISLIPTPPKGQFEVFPLKSEFHRYAGNIDTLERNFARKTAQYICQSAIMYERIKKEMGLRPLPAKLSVLTQEDEKCRNIHLSLKIEAA